MLYVYNIAVSYNTVQSERIAMTRKSITTFAAAFVLATAAVLVFSTFQAQEEKQDTPHGSVGRQEEGESLAQSFFIESMRQRSYGEGSVDIEKLIEDNVAFRSYVVSYQSDGLKLFALMNVPKMQRPESGFPVVIVNHGYINPQTYSTTRSYKTITDFYARNGFVVLKPDYRGHADSETGNTSAINRINYAVDVLNLLAIIDTIADVDPEKIAMYGHSMGGEITLRVLEISDQVKAATLWASAATTFPENMLYFIRRHRPEIAEQIEREIHEVFREQDYEKLSSIDNVELISTPLILHHGTRDGSVPFDWSEELSERLTDAGVSHMFYPYDGENHNFTRGSWSTVVNLDLELFKNYL